MTTCRTAAVCACPEVQRPLASRTSRAIGLLLGSERQVQTTGSTVRNAELLETLYESLLWRSYRGQFSLYFDHDCCSFNQVSERRTVSLEHSGYDQMLDAITKHSQLWDVRDYELWDSCKGDDVHKASSTAMELELFLFTIMRARGAATGLYLGFLVSEGSTLGSAWWIHLLYAVHALRWAKFHRPSKFAEH